MPLLYYSIHFQTYITGVVEHSVINDYNNTFVEMFLFHRNSCI